MISMEKLKRIILPLILILIPITLGLVFNNLNDVETEETELVQISSIEHHDNVDWLKNSDFDDAGSPWFSSTEQS